MPMPSEPANPVVTIRLLDEVIEVVRSGADTAAIGQTPQVQISLVGAPARLPERVDNPQSSAMVGLIVPVSR